LGQIPAGQADGVRSIFRYRHGNGTSRFVVLGLRQESHPFLDLPDPGFTVLFEDLAVNRQADVAAFSFKKGNARLISSRTSTITSLLFQFLDRVAQGWLGNPQFFRCLGHILGLSQLVEVFQVLKVHVFFLIVKSYLLFLPKFSF
jgi:hypothetical protein